MQSENVKLASLFHSKESLPAPANDSLVHVRYRTQLGVWEDTANNDNIPRQ